MRLVIIIGLTVLLAACTAPDINVNKTIEAPSWINIEMTDVATGQTFTFGDFKGKPVLLESFAVWCPTCKRQQDQIKLLHAEVGDSVVSVSLDTDPNEAEQQVLGHMNRHGYDWYFAVSPIVLTQALIDDFGVGIVNAPGAPVLLICPNQSARFLAGGVKSADKLKSEIGAGC
jgi:thiol-disulfide isomerase/thioredoxin